MLAPLASFTLAREHVAVALSHSPMGAGHLGLAFRSAKDGVRVLHLAWHLKLRNDAADEGTPGWAAIMLPVPMPAAKQVAAQVQAIAARLPHVKYGLNFPKGKGSFNGRGEYKAPKGSDGLTCASFVVEVLRSAAVDLVRFDTWQPSAANEQWAAQTCESLAKTGAPQEHVESVRNNINGLRLMPTEVVGAVVLGRARWPASFDEVQQPAGDALRALQRILPPPSVVRMALTPVVAQVAASPVVPVPVTHDIAGGATGDTLIETAEPPHSTVPADLDQPPGL